jgi:rhodanese-related sulfurtransferase
MFSKLITVGLILLLTTLLAACNAVDTKVNSQAKPSTPPASTTTTVSADGAPRITPTELATLIKAGKAYIIDVRNQASYDAGHIPGSRMIPLSEVSNHVNELPRDKTIVTYCTCPNEGSAAVAVNNLKSKGFEHAAALLGGLTDWQKEGHPVEKK